MSIAASLDGDDEGARDIFARILHRLLMRLAFTAATTSVGLADDLQKGLIDRFRSLPMARSAVLVGRTNADVGNNIVTITVMAVTGLLVGWRIRNGVLDALAAFGLLLLFAYAISWLMALVGLSVKSPEVVQNASFIIIFPLTFIANTFVPTDNFPPVLKAFADWNPVSSVTLAARELFGNTSPALPPPDVWPAEHPVVYSLIWIIGIMAVFIPLSVRKYESAAGR